jgi:membrane protease YdiL (CAAX protease family)
MEVVEKKISWNIYDILIVSIILFLADIIFLATLSLITGSSSKAFSLATRYFVCLTTAIIPIIWIKKRYLLDISVLGLRKAVWSNLTLISVTMISSAVCVLILSFLMKGTVVMPNLSSKHLSAIITAPISIGGIPLFILGPIAEEIYFRGFLYSYFVKKFGSCLGLILQAIIFCLFHIYHVKNFGDPKTMSFFFSIFVLGVILGMFYRISRSLYPSMIFHGFFNYLTAISIYATWTP